MVRVYKRKTSRADVDENAVSTAITDILHKVRSTTGAAEFYNIIRTTLISRIRTLKKKYSKEELKTLFQHRDNGTESNEDDAPPPPGPIKAVSFVSKYAVQQVFTLQQEKELVKYLIKCSDMSYGLSYRQVRGLAYDYANIIPECKLPEAWRTNKAAGLDWVRNFMKRHQELSLRKPENTSIARDTAFNRRNVEEFFNNYKSVVAKNDIQPENIFNLDETGFTTVTKPIKIIALKGKKQVSQASSAERGELVTIVGIINAAGGYLPPVYVFPRKRRIEELIRDAPPSSLALGNSSGWMTKELFLEVLAHIQKHTKCSREKKILLMLDNHESHISVAAINYCRENGIIVLSFPPHTSHRLQPCDVAVFGPFKRYCANAFNDWLLTHPGKTIQMGDLALLTRHAFLAAFTPSNIISAFKTPGIWPLNSLVFTDEDFSATDVYDKPAPSDDVSTQGNEESVHQQTQPEPVASKSRDTNGDNAQEKEQLIRAANAVGRGDSQPTPEHVRLLPKVSRSSKPSRRLQGKSKIYTDTPEKLLLKQKEREAEERKRKTAASCSVKNQSKKAVKRQVFPPSSSSSSESEGAEVQLEDEEEVDLISLSEGKHIHDEAPTLLDDEVIDTHDFVLVKFATKTSVKYYIGEVTECNQGKYAIEYDVKFLRRRGVSNSFSFPNIDDLATVERSDIVAKLKADENKGTTRTRSIYSFSTNLKKI